MDSKLINGDSLEVLKDYEDNSVDLLCTDPPYGYGFMGKEWDKFEVKKPTKSQSVSWMSPGMKRTTKGMRGFFIPIWKECYRVLKPGAFAFVMSAPRSDVQYRMTQMLEESGFEVGFTPIYWAYATGFPKAMNVGKKTEKENLEGSYAGYQPKPAVEVVIVCMKPLDKKGYMEQAKDNQKGVTWLDDARIPFEGMNDIPQGGYGDMKVGYGKPGETQPMSKDYEKYVSDTKGFTERSSIKEGEVYSEALDTNPSQKWGFKKPISKDLEQYNKDNVGSQKNFDTEAEGLSRGNQPSRKSKSDYEKYVEKQKSFKGAKTIGNVKEGGTSFLGGDMKQLDTSTNYQRKTTKRKPREENTVFKTSGFKSEDNDTAEASPLGRFAANLLVSDKALDTGKKTKSTGGRAYQNTNDMFSGGWAYDEEGTGENPGKGDEGDFSRYYSLDEWWKSRLLKLAPEVQRTFPFLVVPKASKSEKNMGLDNLEKKQKIYNGPSDKSSKDMKGVERKFTTLPTQNIHPTVKPIQLFSYLVTLGSRKEDIVLDPFMGSGTTPISCVTLDRKYLGIEKEKEYFEIAEARVEKAINPANLVEHDFF